MADRMSLPTTVTAGALRAQVAYQRRSVDDLAAALGVSPSSARRRLSGEIPLRLDEILRCAEWLEVPVGELLPLDRLTSDRIRSRPDA